MQRGGRSERPDEDESEQLGVFDISRILQLLEEVVEKRQKLLTLLAGGRREEKQRDAVFKDADNLALRVELVLVPVVLHQDSVQEQVHHDEGTRGENGLWMMPRTEKYRRALSSLLIINTICCMCP